MKTELYVYCRSGIESRFCYFHFVIVSLAREL
jgi:hypothetical protein